MVHSPIASLAVALILVVSGCGGGGGVSSAPELGQAIVLARDRTDFALARITQARSRDELLDRMDDAATAIDQAARDLDGVRPPNGYERPVDDLVGSLRQLALDVQATADQIRQPGFGELLTGTRGLSFESWNNVNRALSALSRTGIEVAPLERH